MTSGKPFHHSSDQTRQGGLCLCGGGDNAADVSRLESIRKALICDDRETERAHTCMLGDDDFRNGGHSNYVRTDRSEHPVFGTRLEVGTWNRNVDALTKDDAVFQGGGASECPELGIVRRGHVRETRAQPLVIRTNQRIVSQQIDVIADQDQLTGSPLGIHPSTGIGDYEGSGTECVQDPDGECHLGKAVPFVAMEATLHCRHATLAESPEYQPAGVALYSGQRKARDLLVRDGAVDLDFLRQATQTGAKDNSYFGLEGRVIPHRLGGSLHPIEQR